jgi:hypothetical protein
LIDLIEIVVIVGEIVVIIGKIVVIGVEIGIC